MEGITNNNLTGEVFCGKGASCSQKDCDMSGTGTMLFEGSDGRGGGSGGCCSSANGGSGHCDGMSSTTPTCNTSSCVSSSSCPSAPSCTSSSSNSTLLPASRIRSPALSLTSSSSPDPVTPPPPHPPVSPLSLHVLIRRIFVTAYIFGCLLCFVTTGFLCQCLVWVLFAPSLILYPKLREHVMGRIFRFFCNCGSMWFNPFWRLHIIRLPRKPTDQSPLLISSSDHDSSPTSSAVDSSSSYSTAVTVGDGRVSDPSLLSAPFSSSSSLCPAHISSPPCSSFSSDTWTRPPTGYLSSVMPSSSSSTLSLRPESSASSISVCSSSSSLSPSSSSCSTPCCSHPVLSPVSIVSTAPTTPTGHPSRTASSSSTKCCEPPPPPPTVCRLCDDMRRDKSLTASPVVTPCSLFALYDRIKTFLDGTAYAPCRTLLASNHLSASDPWLMSAAIFPWELKFVFKNTLLYLPIAGWAVRLAGDLPVFFTKAKGGWGTKPGSVAKMMARCAELLDYGVGTVVFPEGTRSKTRRLQPFKDGFFKFCVEHDCEVLPCAMHNQQSIWPLRSRLLDCGDVYIAFGDPICPKGMTVEELKRATRQAIADLLKLCPTYDEKTEAPMAEDEVVATRGQGL
eukprot:GHVQ01006562.1.p1 GENE.GHVQ01006562.1~~GHVQ01006562.1.p1  ORF type:complete len:622 (+),score=128.78 GHVQ01006562.1:910-2775(+)